LFLKALEDGEDIEEMGGRGRRNRSSKIMDAESSTRATPVSDSDGGGRGRRARKPKAGIQDYETPAAGKRKRNGKAMSMTPSVVDEDEGRDQKRRKTGKAGPELTAPVKEGMKAAFNECYKAVLNCTDSEGRRRADLFKEIPDKYVRAFFILPLLSTFNNQYRTILTTQPLSRILLHSTSCENERQAEPIAMYSSSRLTTI